MILHPDGGAEKARVRLCVRVTQQVGSSFDHHHRNSANTPALTTSPSRQRCYHAPFSVKFDVMRAGSGGHACSGSCSCCAPALCGWRSGSRSSCSCDVYECVAACLPQSHAFLCSLVCTCAPVYDDPDFPMNNGRCIHLDITRGESACSFAGPTTVSL